MLETRESLVAVVAKEVEVLTSPGLDGCLVTPPLTHPLAVQDAGGESGAQNNVRERRQGRTQP